MSSSSLLGAHDVTPIRAFAAARVLGVLITLWALAAGLTFLLFPRVLYTLGWQPLIDFYTRVGGSTWIAAHLAFVGVLGFLGLAAEANNPTRRWPRRISLASCVLGALWAGISLIGFANAWYSGYANAGPLIVTPTLMVFLYRFWLLVEVPKPGMTIPHA